MSQSIKLAHLAKETPEKHVDILEKIGNGAYGEVYKGRLKATSMIVAVKLIELVDGEVDEMSNVCKEIQILKECDHVNIVQYFGSYLSDKCLWVELKKLWCISNCKLDYFGILWWQICSGHIHSTRETSL